MRPLEEIEQHFRDTQQKLKVAKKKFGKRSIEVDDLRGELQDLEEELEFVGEHQ